MSRSRPTKRLVTLLNGSGNFSKIHSGIYGVSSNSVVEEVKEVDAVVAVVVSEPLNMALELNSLKFRSYAPFIVLLISASPNPDDAIVEQYWSKSYLSIPYRFALHAS
jgi:hypothetical protein